MDHDEIILHKLHDLKETMHRQNHEQRVQLDRMETLLTGGDEPEKGVIIRIDRLEQIQNIIKWVLGTVIGSAIIAAFGYWWK